MRLVCLRIGQHHLKAGHHVVGHHCIQQVGNNYRTQLGVVLRADQHGSRGLDLARHRIKLHTVRHKAAAVAPLGVRGRVRRDGIRCCVGTGTNGVIVSTQVDKTAVFVTQQVVAPAADVDTGIALLPAADTGPVRP